MMLLPKEFLPVWMKAEKMAEVQFKSEISFLDKDLCPEYMKNYKSKNKTR